MPYAGDSGIYYEVEGSADEPTVVLLSGGGAQLLSWRVELVALLRAEGLRVVRMDNRDVGLSRRYGGVDDLDGGYGVEELADDVVAVLDDLGVDGAHLVGHSMGGIMAQVVAIRQPGRVRSLGLLSTLPGHGERFVAHGPRPELLEPPVRVAREQAVEGMRAFALATADARYPVDPQWMADAAGEAYDRGYAPEGFARQWAALLRAPERLELLRSVTVPTLVFHGRDDDVVRWLAAVDTAEAMPDAELQVHAGMGHMIAEQLWPELVAGIVRAVRRGEAVAR